MKIASGKYTCIVFFVLLFLVPVIAGAFDIGLAVDQTYGSEGINKESLDDYQAAILPHFSLPIGDTGNLFFSAGLNLSYINKEFLMVPELLRTEFSWRFDRLRMKAGRIQYTDPLGFIADGLFDGAQFLYDSPAMGTFGAGAWYTGLLYKKRANIMLSPQDNEQYYTPYSIDDFFNTYFAPSRLMFAANWEHPSVAEWFQFKVGILGQMEISDNDSPYHSQYAAAKIGFPAPGLLFELGGGFELIEYSEKLNIAFAGEAGIYWTLPTETPNRISLTGRYTSGVMDDSDVVAFTPITSKPQGDVFGINLSGLSVLGLNYIIRLHKTFSADLTASYYVRNDAKTFRAYPATDNTNKSEFFLGGEVYGKFVWSPVSDLRFTLGGGVFMPSLGNVAPKADNKWRIELGAVIVLF